MAGSVSMMMSVSGDVAFQGLSWSRAPGFDRELRQPIERPSCSFRNAIREASPSNRPPLGLGSFTNPIFRKTFLMHRVEPFSRRHARVFASVEEGVKDSESTDRPFNSEDINKPRVVTQSGDSNPNSSSTSPGNGKSANPFTRSGESKVGSPFSRSGDAKPISPFVKSNDSKPAGSSAVSGDIKAGNSVTLSGTAKPESTPTQSTANSKPGSPFTRTGDLNPKRSFTQSGDLKPKSPFPQSIDSKPGSPFSQSGAKPSAPENPFRKSPILPVDWEEAGARKAGSGKRVLDAFREGQKEGVTTKFGQPLVPKNIFDEVRRTPEEIAADAFKFEISPGQLFLIGSFLIIITVMVGTVFIVWKVGGIHYNEY